VFLEPALGFNIVAYFGTYFAVEQERGPLDLATLTPSDRAALLQAPTLNAIRKRIYETVVDRALARRLSAAPQAQPHQSANRRSAAKPAPPEPSENDVKTTDPSPGRLRNTRKRTTRSAK